MNTAYPPIFGYPGVVVAEGAVVDAVTTVTAAAAEEAGEVEGVTTGPSARPTAAVVTDPTVKRPKVAKVATGVVAAAGDLM